MNVKELQMHWKTLGPYGNRHVKTLRVPFHVDDPVRWVKNKQFRAVEGRMIDESTCEIWAEHYDGSPEILWRGAVIGSLSYMVSQFQNEVCLGE